MADPLVEAYMRQQQQQAYSPQRQQQMVNSLRGTQTTGNMLQALSGGEHGRGLVRGPAPEEYQAQLQSQAFNQNRATNRDAIRDQQWMMDYAQKGAGLKYARGAKYADKIDKQVDAISKGMKDLQPAMTAYRNAAGLVTNYGDGDIPGIGMIEGGPGMIGTMSRFFQGPEAQENFATVQMLFNKLMRGEIGSQQTIQEAQRMRQTYGATGFESEEVFRAMLPKIGEALEYEQAQILSRGNDDAVALWQQRNRTSATAPQQQAPQENKVVNWEDL